MLVLPNIPDAVKIFRPDLRNLYTFFHSRGKKESVEANKNKEGTETVVHYLNIIFLSFYYLHRAKILPKRAYC